MQKQLILLAVILITISSCKKGSSAPPTPPAMDTSYLRKTEITYTYDVAGKKLADSSITKWAYDSKGRPVLYVSNYSNGINIDTTSNTYGSNQVTYDGVVYSSGTLFSHSHKVSFYNSKGLVDSSISTGTSFDIINGIPSPTNYASTDITVYYFDVSGNDTLDVMYTITNGTKALSGMTRKTYINNTLSTLDSYSGNGIKYYSVQWAAGNITTDAEYNYLDGTPIFTHNYTYSSVLSGGFYGYTGTKNLLATFEEINVGFPVNNYSETLSYSFDSVNRVSSVTRKYSNGHGDQQEIYTYY